MAKWQLDHLTDLSQLLFDTTDVVIADTVVSLLIISNDRLTLSEYLSFVGDSAVVDRLGGLLGANITRNHFELNRSE